MLMTMMMTVLFSFSNWNWLVVIHGFSFVLIAVVCFFCPTDCQNLFGIIYRCPQEMKEKLLMFRLVGDEINKQEWLQKLTTGLANTACTADTVFTVFTPLTVTARNTILIRHFWNLEGQQKHGPQLFLGSLLGTRWSSIRDFKIQRRTATRTLLKNWICVPSVFIAIIPIHLSNVGEPSWSWISRPRTMSKLTKRNKISSLLVYVLHKTQK